GRPSPAVGLSHLCLPLGALPRPCQPPGPRVRRGRERLPVVARGRAPPPPCQPADTCHHLLSPAAGGVLRDAPRRAGRRPRRPCGRPPEREGPRPGAAVAWNMHKVGPAVVVEREGSARPLLDT